MLFRCIHSDGLGSLGDDEVSKVNELRDQGAKLGILSADKNRPLILHGLLIEVINVARVLISVVVVAYLQFKSELLVTSETLSHHFLEVLLVFDGELLLYDFLEVLIHIHMVVLHLEI